MRRISKYEWDRMSNEEVIDFWEEHDYATGVSLVLRHLITSAIVRIK